MQTTIAANQYSNLTEGEARSKCVESAVNAIAMMAGFAGQLPATMAIGRVRTALADAVGGVQVFHELATYAVLSFDIMVATQGEFTSEPGVYCFEVDEPFGEWWREFCLTFKDQPNELQCKSRLGALAWDYFKRLDEGDERAQAARIIEELTGYREGKA